MRSVLVIVLICSVLSCWADQVQRTVHVRGTISNVAELGIKSSYSAVILKAPHRMYPTSMVDPISGDFVGELQFEVTRNAYGRWVEIELRAMSYMQDQDRRMVIRVPFTRTMDLGRFDWKPSHYRWSRAGLSIDTAVPRDTVLVDQYQMALLRISPINPAPTDTMRITVEWTSSGQPIVANDTSYDTGPSEHILALRAGQRTDTEIFTESFMMRATLYVFANLAPGRYRLIQQPLMGEHVMDMDLLFGQEIIFNVEERTGP